ncbi:MAG: N-acetylneuraminate synthase family protein [Deltaproteobacteria bacterium]|nr:N-acetylneuraminate synthase family protein [Deltaproteobacteria bacterium]
MKIADFNTDEEILVIAEIGNNHEGSYSLAEEMIGLAAEAGAGAVKFQTIVPEKLVSLQQKERIAQLKRFQLSYQDFERLSEVAKQENIIFLSTPFDIESARFLEPLVVAYKIGSGDNNFYPLIDVIARTGKPVIMSSGLMDLEEVKKSVDFISQIWNKNAIDQEMAVLQCVTSYPSPPNEVNLLTIRELQRLNVTAGYSDHTLGIEAALLSTALGARIIEKHFTIDKNYSDFRDHQLSADPAELTQLVERIKEASILLGRSNKNVQESESSLSIAARRSLVAAQDLEKNCTITWENLSWVRPGGGIAPGNEEMILGKKLKTALKAGEMILPDNVA